MKNSNDTIWNFFYFFFIFIAIWLHFSCTLLNLSCSKQIGHIEQFYSPYLTFTLMYTSRHVHFHCYSLSVIATLIAVILIVQVSYPFSSVHVEWIYFSPTSRFAAGVGGFLHYLQYIQIAAYCLHPLCLLIFFPSCSA